MPYLDRLATLRQTLEDMGSPARLDIPFAASSPPTQAFSEFLTNKEQGDWAERSFVENFNRTYRNLRAVKYGRSEDLVAGEPGFSDYYARYQQELGLIGKRPDLLLFPVTALPAPLRGEIDISNLDMAQLDELVPKAVAAVEVRSSAFLSLKYDEVALQTRLRHEKLVIDCAQSLLKNHQAELPLAGAWPDYLNRLIQVGIEQARDPPRAMSRSSTTGLQKASDLTKQIKEALRSLRQRDFLSVTPKAEDLSLVYRWVQRYGVPHHYCQVFFDRAVVISFENILTILADPEKENIEYFIETDEKNQRKTTFKINVSLGQKVMSDIVLPTHCSVMKELPKGRLLFYVRFGASQASFRTEAFPDA